MKVMVTGGAGFIGSAVVRCLLNAGMSVVCVDKLSYAGHQASLDEVAEHPSFVFERQDICDRTAMKRSFREHGPDAVMHLAAETHVDRSISGPDAFVKSNVLGTFSLLSETHAYWESLPERRRAAFRFLHMSTDEVFGPLTETAPPTDEKAPYAPSSPYSATKAGADHLVAAWVHTYGFPALTVYGANNFGPRQFPEKLIPLMILNALAGKPLPLYGEGNQRRDWLFVEDGALALLRVLAHGRPGERYNVAGREQKRNRDVVIAICDLLEKMAPGNAVARQAGGAGYASLIRQVEDRSGHDFRYAMDDSRMREQTGWRPQYSFAAGLEKTVAWYLENGDWCRQVQAGHQHDDYADAQR